MIRNEYTLATAAKVSDLTKHMVAYLARAGIVVPSTRTSAGRGVRRLYTFGDLVALKTVAALLKSGIEARKLKSSLATLQQRYGKTWRSAPAEYFCTDGRRVFFKSANGVYADLSNGAQLVFQFVVDLQFLHAEAAAEVERLTKLSRRSARRRVS